MSTLSLQAAHQLAQDGAGRWRSLGDDPYFLADPAQRRLGPGWHAVEMAARAAEGDTLLPSLYSWTGRLPTTAPAIVAVAAVANLLTFGTFNPVQSADPIFHVDSA